jgi:hypothetical protein
MQHNAESTPLKDSASPLVVARSSKQWLGVSSIHIVLLAETTATWAEMVRPRERRIRDTASDSDTPGSGRGGRAVVEETTTGSTTTVGR